MALSRFAPPTPPVDGHVLTPPAFHERDCSFWLSQRLEAQLGLDQEIKAAALPIALGSWARGELSAKSDIDLLCVGDEAAASDIVRAAQENGFRIRARTPENRDDWTQGVAVFDVLALLEGLPLHPRAQELWSQQCERVLARKAFSSEVLRTLKKDRAERHARYDSISNFLEPNLKYGPGGLRDLQQSFLLQKLFARRQIGTEHAYQVFGYYRHFFVSIRQRLHFLGVGDILAAGEQEGLAHWLGYPDHRTFMREVQKGLARVSFYNDWIFAQISSSRAKQARYLNMANTTPMGLLEVLKRDPSIQMQERVRRRADQVFADSKADFRKLGRGLRQMLLPQAPDALTVALFRSRLLDHLVPEIRPLVGLVQHDQYHRFAADVHLLQALRELKRVYRQPRRLGRLAKMFRGLKARDWEILAWTCLYHDLAKGRSEDHSILGEQFVHRDLKRFGVKDEIADEVKFLVRRHLAISVAAFRQNPHSPKTWRDLAAQGIEGHRVTLLTAFTAVDILATNPEAWTPWKERLLADLHKVLTSTEADRSVRFGRQMQKARLGHMQDFMDRLDPMLIEALPARLLLADMRILPKSQGDLPLLIARDGRNGYWLRWHERVDRQGVFVDIARRLFSAGCNIRHAYVHTDPQFGVYDWFQVRSEKAATVLRRLLERPVALPTPKVNFDAIELVRADDEEWIFSFRGRDQTGALIAAAETLFAEHLSIRWAKVQTWGRQIDDVFSVAPAQDSAGTLATLRQLCGDGRRSKLV